MASKTYGDMLEVVQRITAARPSRCLDNLEITSRLIDRLGLEGALKKLRFVHIAGTKGKGTCSQYTSQLLRAHGRRVGLFTSPHLIDIRERIVVDGEMLSHERFAKYFFDVYDCHQSLLDSDSDWDRDLASRANFFRLMFLMSIHAFASEGVEIGVMEVGIGGRIDATNVIHPVVCGITSLGMDHMEILGDTMELIAAEKAGIMKPNVPCFSVAQVEHPETRRVLEKRSREVDCPLVFMDPGILPIRSWPQLAIGGEHAVTNSKLALMLARTAAEVPITMPLLPEEITALQTTVYAGRSQVIKVNERVTVYLDGAHTPESIEMAAKWFFSTAADAATEATHRRMHTNIAAEEARLSEGDSEELVSAPQSHATTGGGRQQHRRNVLLFYSTRNPSALFKPLMPYTQGIQKIVIASIHTPKTPLSGVTEDHREHLLPYVEAWRKLYPEIPCLPCAAPFDSWANVEELVCDSTGDSDDETVPVNIFVTGSFFLIGDILNLLRGHHVAPQS
eukprot:CAMPEP_0176429588 /NCGR_PEP_ID=MMETSP0127-20121128/13792_1 /TAXON_ID=938130 /ORGANISM="Platyophrya macrostoma, Strain WH" /LENGTH=506 /DNA_ID=CAMNT_0017811405 /DNA_START=72 /DNA_END=1592 /DNA_ORIENTATION=+